MRTLVRNVPLQPALGEGARAEGAFQMTAEHLSTEESAPGAVRLARSAKRNMEATVNQVTRGHLVLTVYRPVALQTVTR
jgi:hypothetical protein